MAHESVRRSDYEPEAPLLDSTLSVTRPRREIVARATGVLREVGSVGLLVLFAAEESIRHRRAPLSDDIEQLREYGDWVD